MVNKVMSTFQVIHSESNGVGLGHGGMNKSIITKPSFDRGIKCLKNYSKTCNRHNIDTIYAYGTSTLRQAKNANKFVELVKKQTNIEIKILSGKEEAKLIYKGIKMGYDFHEKSVIMDIGGGSTEFILADKNGLIDKASFDIGISRINQLFNFGDKLSITDITSIENYLNKNIGKHIDHYKAHQLIGSSGSFKTFFELVNKKKYEKKLYQKISLNSINSVLNNLINSSLQDRINNKYILPLRRDLLAISAVKTRWVLKKLQCKQVIVSPNSLKEGVIYTNLL